MTRTLSRCFMLCLFLSPIAMADQVIREVPDNTGGKGYGALTGLMVGAAGGPIGALVGAGAGFWLGGSLQEGTHLSGTAYEVENAKGERSTVRSPNARFTPGQQVSVQGSRLVLVGG